MKYLLLISSCLLLNCTAKKPLDHLPDQEAEDLFSQICERELERHGQAAFSAQMRTFGNQYMDLYLEQGRSPEILWRQVQQAPGVCRGAFLYLMCNAHPEYVERNILSLDEDLTDLDRVFLIDTLHMVAREQSAELYFFYLSSGHGKKVRAGAARSIDYLPQENYAQRILAIMEREQDETVLSPLVLSLDLRVAEIQEVLPLLSNHPLPSVNTMVLNNLALSSLENKKELIRPYLEHPEPYVAELAESHLERLRNKDKLGWKTSITKIEVDTHFEADPRIQLGLLKAVYLNDKFKVEAWLTKGALPGVVAKWHIPFHESVLYCDDEIIELLLEQGNPKGDLLTSRNDSGENALMNYVQRKEKIHPRGRKWEQAPAPLSPIKPALPRFKLLQQLGLDLNAVNRKGETALHLAVLKDQPELVKALLQSGVNAGIRDQTGRTAYDWALIFELETITQPLLEATIAP